MSHPLHEENLNLVKEERRLTGLVIENLQKTLDQGLHLKMGYSSLFEYCTRALGYSESCAYRRISAVRLVKEIPEVKKKLDEGTLNLTNITMAQSFFSKVKPSVEIKRGVLEKIENCSKKEAETRLALWAPQVPIGKPESVRICSSDEASLHVRLSKATLGKLDRLKEIRSHKKPGMKYAELIDDMCEYLLKKLDPTQDTGLKTKPAPKTNLTTKAKLASKTPRSLRYVSKKIKIQVYQRDRGQCTFQAQETGKRCSSRHLLQIDHIQPLSLGGPTKVENLRLLCHAHHRLRGRVVGSRL